MPTDDYIKRDDVKTAVFAWYVDAMRHGEKKYLDEVIAKIPAADVEKVVYCRDCKYRDQRIPVHNAICTKCYEIDCMQGYGFCSMGERMEEDDA